MKKNQLMTVFVTGTPGHLGRRVVELLLEAQAGRVVATTRSLEKLEDLAQRGAVVRKAEFDDPKSLADAFARTDRLLLISTEAIDWSGRRLEQHRAAVAAAKRAGVKHIVSTSFHTPTLIGQRSSFLTTWVPSRRSPRAA